MTALGAALFGTGIPKDSVLNYETSLKANKFILIALGTIDEVEHARDILAATDVSEATIHRS